MTTLKSLISRDGVVAHVDYGTTYTVPPAFRSEGAKTWTVRLTRKRRQITVPFFTGSAITHDPTPHDVLECLLSDAVDGEMIFEEWAEDLGYDADSREAYATWKACGKIAKRVRRFLGDDETFEEYAYADRD
jgi:hypothetical protein